MSGLQGLNLYVNYKEDSLYGASLYRGNTVLWIRGYLLKMTLI
jgi:hypothetical protein